MDPTAEEESLMTGSFTITTNTKGKKKKKGKTLFLLFDNLFFTGKIYSISKLGGTAISAERLSESIAFANENAAEWNRLVQDAANNTSPMKH